jgi:hypothetical protein
MFLHNLLNVQIANKMGLLKKYRTAGKITGLNILIFTFLTAGEKTEGSAPKFKVLT